MKSDKEIWIEEVLASTNQMERAKAPEHLFAKIKLKTRQANANSFRVKPLQAWWAAAAILILFLLNFAAIKRNFTRHKQFEMQSLIKDYGLEQENYGL